MTIEPCNNTSVGILVVRDGRLLLIERRRPPYGWAPPAGHVDPGEPYPDAAIRETQEEVGLPVDHLQLLWRGDQKNRCRRPGGDWHYWAVYEATTTGEPTRSEDETSAMRWVSRDQLAGLAELTRNHLAAGSGPDEWRQHPGLEPVWLDMLTTLGWIGGAQ